ncbi:MAG: AbrB/MazE/SpoVT family DNA-binding domain-containing protein [Bryobacteraceae bacterium]|nr:AbrB/MazE/SpoVT family DNA-binding domain-containing protein [Bryobacteraceae bacterium]
MLESTKIPVAPNGLEEAPCDDRWRIRLQKRYADFFLSFEPIPEKAAKIYVATLNGEDALIWPNDVFQDWAHRLRIDPNNREKNRLLLRKAQFFGGESDIDRQGRFVLPKKVREGMHLEEPVTEFQVFNDGIIRLIKRALSPDERLALTERRDLDDYAVDRYTSHLLGPSSLTDGDSR